MRREEGSEGVGIALAALAQHPAGGLVHQVVRMPDGGFALPEGHVEPSSANERQCGDDGHTDFGVASVAVVIYTLDLSTLTADYEVADGDRLFGETTYKVTVPSGATVRINGIRLTGGAVDPVTPEFSEGGESVTTKFEQGEGDTWKITAWGEIGNDASGTGVADGQIKVYRGDEVDDVTTPVTPTITKKKSAVKVEMTVEAPSGKDRQFFRVNFGE